VVARHIAAGGDVGIPAVGIGLLMAVDAIPDMFATTLNVTADMTAAAIVSRGRAGFFAAGDVAGALMPDLPLPV
jgi:Na+/H+-dicarboxylate symporter